MSSKAQCSRNCEVRELSRSAGVRFADFHGREHGFDFPERTSGRGCLIDDNPVGIDQLASTRASCVSTSGEEHSGRLNGVLRVLKIHAHDVGHDRGSCSGRHFRGDWGRASGEFVVPITEVVNGA